MKSYCSIFEATGRKQGLHHQGWVVQGAWPKPRKPPNELKVTISHQLTTTSPWHQRLPKMQYGDQGRMRNFQEYLQMPQAISKVYRHALSKTSQRLGNICYEKKPSDPFRTWKKDLSQKQSAKFIFRTLCRWARQLLCSAEEDTEPSEDWTRFLENATSPPVIPGNIWVKIILVCYIRVMALDLNIRRDERIQDYWRLRCKMQEGGNRRKCLHDFLHCCLVYISRSYVVGWSLHINNFSISEI